MTSPSLMAELHVRQFNSQQKHQDELNRRDCASQGLGVRGFTGSGRKGWRQRAINSAGPLCLLDAVGQAEESWLELFEHAPRCELPRPRRPAATAFGSAGLDTLTA